MGTNTTNLNLYKPATTEMYDVDKDLNENWEKLDALGVRYVVSTDTDGTWTWHTWNDGTIDAFADLSISSGTSWTAWGGHYYVTKNVTIPTAIGITSKPTIIASLDSGADAWANTILTEVKSTGFKVQLLRPVATNINIAYKLAVHLISFPASNTLDTEE